MVLVTIAVEEMYVYMRFEELNFRDLCHKICFISRSENFDYMTDSLPGKDRANGTLVYCYVDHDAGVSFEILACALWDEDKLVKVFDGNENVSLKYRMDAVENCQIQLLEQHIYKELFKEKIDMIHDEYKVNGNIGTTRDAKELDDSRSKEYPDDILVILCSDERQPEGCWVRCEGKMGREFYGFLLNEPYGDFPVHKGDIIRFKAIIQSDGTRECIAYY